MSNVLRRGFTLAFTFPRDASAVVRFPFTPLFMGERRGIRVSDISEQVALPYREDIFNFYFTEAVVEASARLQRQYSGSASVFSSFKRLPKFLRNIGSRRKCFAGFLNTSRTM